MNVLFKMLKVLFLVINLVFHVTRLPDKLFKVFITVTTRHFMVLSGALGLSLPEVLNA